MGADALPIVGGGDGVPDGAVPAVGLGEVFRPLGDGAPAVTVGLGVGGLGDDSLVRNSGNRVEHIAAEVFDTTVQAEILPHVGIQRHALSLPFMHDPRAHWSPLEVGDIVGGLAQQDLLHALCCSHHRVPPLGEANFCDCSCSYGTSGRSSGLHCIINFVIIECYDCCFRVALSGVFVVAKATRSFREWIEDRLGTAPAGARLPSLSTLSRDWSLSVSTVRTVLGRYVATGRLTVLHGKGYFIGTPLQPRHHEPAAPSTSCERLVRVVKEDIAAGVLKVGAPLPLVKQAVPRYGVSATTVSRAYRALSAEGLAHRVGKRYYVRSPQTATSNTPGTTAVVFLAPGMSARDLVNQGDMGAAFREMEYELYVHGVKLAFARVDEMAERFVSWRHAGRRPRGAIFPGITPSHHALIRPWLVRLRQARWYAGMRGLLIGRRVGDRVPGIPFLCEGTVATGQCRMLAGFVREKHLEHVYVFYRADRSDSAAWRGMLRLLPETTHLVPNASVRFVADLKGTGATPEVVYRDMGEGDESYVENVISKYSRRPLKQLIDATIASHDFEALIHDMPQRSLCVFCDDRTAVETMASGAVDGRLARDDLHVIGIQNDPSCYGTGLSTCVPDWRTIGYVTAHAFLGDIPYSRTRRGYIGTPSLIWSRQTTF
ncbi:MAG: GntR family transcriptional regulator [Chitinivibrionales bacterium]|nr:GntR family transcriptional regulator [Chitinivibrionales bacterium]